MGSKTDSTRTRLPRGVSALATSRGGRGYRATIRRGKAGEVHLGLFANPWHAAFAHEVAAKALRREGGHALEIPQADQPTADEVAAITESVHRRLGIGPPPKSRRPIEVEPTAEDVEILFELTVVGFWRSQAAGDASDAPGSGLDAAARQLVACADLIYWRRSPGHPTPLGAMTRLLGRRLDAAFRSSALTREVLDDDGDDPRRVARWLVHPDTLPGGRGRGFRAEVRHLYAEFFDESPADLPPWADVLGVTPPLTLDRVQSAYRRRSRVAHPDAGGTHAAFIRLQAAYDEAKAYLDDVDRG